MNLRKAILVTAVAAFALSMTATPSSALAGQCWTAQTQTFDVFSFGVSVTPTSTTYEHGCSDEGQGIGSASDSMGAQESFEASAQLNTATNGVLPAKNVEDGCPSGMGPFEAGSCTVVTTYAIVA